MWLTLKIFKRLKRNVYIYKTLTSLDINNSETSSIVTNPPYNISYTSIITTANETKQRTYTLIYDYKSCKNWNIDDVITVWKLLICCE